MQGYTYTSLGALGRFPGESKGGDGGNLNNKKNDPEERLR